MSIIRFNTEGTHSGDNLTNTTPALPSRYQIISPLTAFCCCPSRYQRFCCLLDWQLGFSSLCQSNCTKFGVESACFISAFLTLHYYNCISFIHLRCHIVSPLSRMTLVSFKYRLPSSAVCQSRVWKLPRLRRPAMHGTDLRHLSC